MITLKESILSSTKTGKQGLIEKWINDFLLKSNDIWTFELYNKDNHTYILFRGKEKFCNFTNKEVYISGEALKNMPKEINGFYQIKVKSGIENLIPCKIIFYEIKNTEIDLSFLSYTKNDIKNAYEPLLTFRSCDNIKITGKPTIEGPYRILIDFCENVILDSIKSKNLVLNVCYTTAKEILNCDFKTLNMDSKISKFITVFNDYQDIFSSKVYFTDEFDKWINNINKNNKIKQINIDNTKHGASCKITTETSNGKTINYIIDKNLKKELEKQKIFR